MKIPLLRTHEAARHPFRGSAHASGWDLHACEALTLAPGARKLVGTGIRVAIPVGFEMQIRPRSGLAYRHGVTILNAPGTIDADYRGEVKVLLVNLGTDDFEICVGDRIAQAVVARHETVEYVDVDVLPSTERGEGGFGHTGMRTAGDEK